MVSLCICAGTENQCHVAEADHRKDYMGECDQAASESILDFFYEQVSQLKLLHQASRCKFLYLLLTSFFREVSWPCQEYPWTHFARGSLTSSYRQLH